MLIKIDTAKLEIRKPSLTGPAWHLLNRKITTLPAGVEVKEQADAFILTGKAADLYKTLWYLSKSFDIELM